MIPIGLLLYAFGNTAPIAAEPGLTIVLSIIYTLDCRRRDRRGVRLHGRPDRRVEQPDLGRRHPVGARHLADPRRAVPGRSAATRPRRWSPSRLFVTAIIFGVATISNNNLQDLKTGQLVEATPVAAAGRAGPRRRVRRAGHPADPRPPQHGLHLPGRARRQGQPRSRRRRPRSSRPSPKACSAGSRLEPDPRRARSSAWSRSSSTKC